MEYIGAVSGIKNPSYESNNIIPLKDSKKMLTNMEYIGAVSGIKNPSYESNNIIPLKDSKKMLTNMEYIGAASGIKKHNENENEITTFSKKSNAFLKDRLLNPGGTINLIDNPRNIHPNIELKNNVIKNKFLNKGLLLDIPKIQGKESVGIMDYNYKKSNLSKIDNRNTEKYLMEAFRSNPLAISF